MLTPNIKLTLSQNIVLYSLCFVLYLHTCISLIKLYAVNILEQKRDQVSLLEKGFGNKRFGLFFCGNISTKICKKY